MRRSVTIPAALGVALAAAVGVALIWSRSHAGRTDRARPGPPRCRRPSPGPSRTSAGSRSSTTWCSSCRRTGRSITTSARSPVPTACPTDARGRVDVCIPEPVPGQVRGGLPLHAAAGLGRQAQLGGVRHRHRRRQDERVRPFVARPGEPVLDGADGARLRALRGPAPATRRRELPHAQGDPELLDLREAVRAPGPDVRAGRLLDAPRAPVPRLRRGRPSARTSGREDLPVERRPDRARARPGSTRTTRSTGGPTSPGSSTTRACRGATTSVTARAGTRRASPT